MSGVIAKSGQFQKVQGFLSLIKEIPMLAQRINIDYFIKLLVESMDWDPEDVLLQQQPPSMPPQGQPGQQGMPGGGMPQQGQGMPNQLEMLSNMMPPQEGGQGGMPLGMPPEGV